MTIIEHNDTDNLIRGTFFFNYEDEDGVTHPISGGQFEVEYVDQTEEELQLFFVLELQPNFQ